MDIENILPSAALNQFDGLATSPEGKTWTCPVCGVMPAKELTLGNKTRFIRQLCECQKRERARIEVEERERARVVHLQRRIYTWLGDTSNLALQFKRFSNFEDKLQPKALKQTKGFLDLMHGSLVLHGTYGTGKTHLLAALCNQLLHDRKQGSLFVTAPGLFGTIQARIQQNLPYDDILKQAKEAPLLVIDDVDKSKHSEFKEDIYFDIINQRVNAGRPIALSTNKLTDLDKFMGGAVASRLKIGQVDAEMIGIDYRTVMEA